MPKDLPITQVNTQPINIPFVPISQGRAKVAEQIGNIAFDQAQRMKAQSEKNYALKLEAEMSRRINEIENEYANDPAAMQDAYAKYQKDLLQSIPSNNMRTQVEAKYGVAIQPAINRANTRRRNIMDADTETQARLNLDAETDTMLRHIDDLLSGDELRATEAGQAVQLSMQNIASLISSTKSDGTGVFTPEQRASKTFAARDTFFKSVVSRWAAGQEDKLLAMQQWDENGLVINFPDEEGNPQKINLKDAMGPQVAKKVKDDIVQQIKDEYNIAANIARVEEQALEKSSDSIMRQFIPAAQAGELTVGQVEAAKSSMTTDDYQNMRLLAVKGNPVTDNRIYGDMLARANRGENVQTEAEAAFKAGKLSVEDMQALNNIVDGERSGVVNPVRGGEKYLVDSLGGLSEGLDFLKSTTIANAQRDYAQKVAAFERDNGRLPSQTEAYKIADGILPDWQVVNANEIAQVTRKPMFMSVGEKASPNSMTSERLDAIKQQTVQHFMQKHGGNMESALQDPEFLQQKEALDVFYGIVEQQKMRQSRGRPDLR